MGVDFQRVLQHFGIKDVPTSVCNPQSNSICERLHQWVGNALRVYLSQDDANNIGNIAELVDSALATALHAARSTIHHTLGMTPAALSSTEICFSTFLCLSISQSCNTSDKSLSTITSVALTNAVVTTITNQVTNV
jgi:hypothetical protein